MKVIIIAAGEGSRMGKLTELLPKPLITVNGLTIIEKQILSFRKNNIKNFFIITGPHSEKFDLKEITYINDSKYTSHDTLGSFMCARDYLNEEIIVTYGDQIFDEKIIEQVKNFSGDIGIAIDLEWEKNYEGRDQHPKSEAENVLLDNQNNILELRKNISSCKENQKIGESLGLMRFSKKASKKFIERYSELNDSHSGKFHNADTFNQAIISDMLQELIDLGLKVEPIFIRGKWCEIDTPQDLERARKIFT